MCKEKDLNNNLSTIHQFEYSDTKQSQPNTNEIKISDINLVSSCVRSSVNTKLELNTLSIMKSEDKLLKEKLYPIISNYISDSSLKQLPTKDKKVIHVIDSIIKDNRVFNLDTNKVSYDINSPRYKECKEIKEEWFHNNIQNYIQHSYLECQDFFNYTYSIDYNDDIENTIYGTECYSY